MRPVNSPHYTQAKASLKQTVSRERWKGKSIFTPILAPFIQDRRMILLLSSLVTVNLLLTAWGLPFWQCPIKSFFGLPGPGCGLSTAMIFLMHGDWKSAMTTHAFSPVFFVGLVVILLIVMLPRVLHRRAVHWIAELEKRTGFALFLLLSVLVYGIIRLLA